MKLTTLIRGHEYYRGGTARNFGDDTCYTVHSTTDQHGLYEPYSKLLIWLILIRKFFLMKKSIFAMKMIKCRRNRCTEDFV